MRWLRTRLMKRRCAERHSTGQASQLRQKTRWAAAGMEAECDRVSWQVAVMFDIAKRTLTKKKAYKELYNTQSPCAIPASFWSATTVFTTAPKKQRARSNIHGAPASRMDQSC